ncbi:protein arginine N-methyltransferase 5 isoform X2 [Tetranychus urticae]|nr:protein arginine N-methyltransferase 5 isoform X2 [Tetranychus urticae]
MPNVGFMPPTYSDLKETLKSLTNNKYDFMVIKLVTRRLSKLIPVCDLNLPNSDWVNHIFSYIETNECYDKENFSLPYLETSLTYARHLSLRNIIVECPQEIDAITRLARVLSGKIFSSHSYANVLIHVPLQLQSKVHQEEGTINKKFHEHDTWKLFNHLRSHIGYDSRLGLCLEVAGDIPDKNTQKRWLGEPIKMILINSDLFVPDKDSFVRIPEPWMEFIVSILRASCRKIAILVKGKIPVSYMKKVALYLNEVFDTYRSNSLIDQFATGYEDILQVPLQPLQDNLESGTYEIFERDPVKYNKYTAAMTVALKRLPKEKPVVVLLVGAGRGPLIRCSLIAAAETGHEVHLYAIEKNECAANTLENQNLVKTTLNLNPKSFVKIVNSDIREWDAPELADIVISELLGSFGDNELSPECLDGVWKSVKPTAISIPESYRSYIGPAMSAKLYSDTLALNEGDKQSKTDYHYVSLMKGFYPIDSPKVLFTFEHTELSKCPKERDNQRYKVLEFKADIDCILHGFAGYFDCTLIKGIDLSIAPHNFTEDLISWFPMWIPLSKPVDVPANKTISVHFWRNVSKSKVWYEWCISEPEPTPIQNPSGRSYFIGLV